MIIFQSRFKFDPILGQVYEGTDTFRLKVFKKGKKAQGSKKRRTRTNMKWW